ncbi:MAG: polysaccharide biosynthesis C-terminal domain-containing protein [Thermotogae bacterium]|nr:polysaccharide biosynthesis C-terminal domain-containing protein [Thermotogota bacterium]
MSGKVGLNIILVPKYGIIGFAIGGMLSISSVNIIKTIEVYIALKMVPYNGKYLKLIVAGVGTAIIVSVFRNVTLGCIWYVCDAWYEFSDYDGYTGDHWIVSGR